MAIGLLFSFSRVSYMGSKYVWSSPVYGIMDMVFPPYFSYGYSTTSDDVSSLEHPASMTAAKTDARVRMKSSFMAVRFFKLLRLLQFACYNKYT